MGEGEGDKCGFFSPRASSFSTLRPDLFLHENDFIGQGSKQKGAKVVSFEKVGEINMSVYPFFLKSHLCNMYRKYVTCVSALS